MARKAQPIGTIVTRKNGKFVKTQKGWVKYRPTTLQFGSRKVKITHDVRVPATLKAGTEITMSTNGRVYQRINGPSAPGKYAINVKDWFVWNVVPA